MSAREIGDDIVIDVDYRSVVSSNGASNGFEALGICLPDPDLSSAVRGNLAGEMDRPSSLG